MGRLPLVLAVAVFACRAAGVGATEGDKPAPPIFDTSVSIVSVPVFVVDRHGQAVRGLGAEDFRLFDDGKPARVVSFQYVDTTSVESQAEIREAPAARRHFLLLFDLSFTNPGGLHRARVAARQLVRERLAPSDLAGVATFDVNRGVRIVANFTDDRALLAHAVDTLGAPSFTRINDPLALAASLQPSEINPAFSRRSRDDLTVVSDTFIQAIALRFRAAEEQLYRAQVSTLVGSLQDLGRALRGVEGRKQVLYFSTGFDAQPMVGHSSTSEMGEAGESATEGRLWEVDGEARYGDSRLRTLLAEMVRTLSSSDCVVHSVDINGLGSDSSLTQTSVSRDPGRDTRGRESLSFLATETGGRLFKDTNDLGIALAEVLEMTSRYYILGYQPDDLAGPGRFHKLKVKVERKGCRLSHRAGYYEREPLKGQMVLQKKFEAAQLVMSGVGATTLRFSALCLPFPAPGERQTLGIVLQVPKGELAWKAGLALELYGYAVAQDGSVQDHLAQLARVDPETADPDHVAEGMSFYGTLQVPAGQYTIKLMVLDPRTGDSGVQFLDVVVPEADPRVGFLLPPVLVDDPRHWLGLDMGSGKGGRPEFPFTMAGQVFLPRTTFRVQSGRPETLVLIAYEPGRRTDPDAGIEIQSAVTDASGRSFPPGPLRVDHVHRDAGGRRTYVLAYTPEGLEPGEYRLRIGIGESGSRLESYSLLRVAPVKTGAR